MNQLTLTVKIIAPSGTDVSLKAAEEAILTKILRKATFDALDELNLHDCAVAIRGPEILQSF